MRSKSLADSCSFRELLQIVSLFTGHFAGISLPRRDFQFKQVLNCGFLGGEHLPQQHARLHEPRSRDAAFEFEAGNDAPMLRDTIPVAGESAPREVNILGGAHHI